MGEIRNIYNTFLGKKITWVVGHAIHAEVAFI